MLAGYVLGIAIISVISALLIKLAAKLIVGKSADFAASFIISFISFLVALFVQILFEHKEASFWAVLPGIVFFIICWLLNVQFVRYGEENISIGFPKVFLVTLLQCIGLFIVFLIFSFVFISGLLYLGSTPR